MSQNVAAKAEPEGVRDERTGEPAIDAAIRIVERKMSERMLCGHLKAEEYTPHLSSIRHCRGCERESAAKRDLTAKPSR